MTLSKVAKIMKEVRDLDVTLEQLKLMIEALHKLQEEMISGVEEKRRFEQKMANREKALLYVRKLGLDVSDLNGPGLPYKLEITAGKARNYVQVPQIYRDPESMATWSGRGKQPQWVRKQLNEGRTLQDLKAA
jgi:DNA-binding protein H-NS